MQNGQKISEMIDRYDFIDTPIGVLLLAGCERYLRLVGFSKGSHAQQPLQNWLHDPKAFVDAKTQILEYFAGVRQDFDLAIMFDGTDFQKRAWAALQNIPYGETRSYGEQAKMIGNPKAVRAVGGANNKNPLPIIIPCHRVIGADGKLVGFGGGLDVKEFLLKHETPFRQVA